MDQETQDRPPISEQAKKAAQIQHEEMNAAVKALSAVVSALPNHLPNGWGPGETRPDWYDLTNEERATELFRGWLALAGVRQQGYLEFNIPGFKLTLGPRSFMVMERN